MNDLDKTRRNSLIRIDSIEYLLAMKEDSFFVRKNIQFESTKNEYLLTEIENLRIEDICNVKKEDSTIIFNLNTPTHLPNVSTEVLMKIFDCFKVFQTSNILWTMTESNINYYQLEMILEIEAN